MVEMTTADVEAPVACERLATAGEETQRQPELDRDPSCSSKSSRTKHLQPYSAWQEKQPPVLASSSSSLARSDSNILDQVKGMVRSPHRGGGAQASAARRQVIAPKLLRNKPEKRNVTRADLYIIDWLLGSRTGQYCSVFFYGIFLIAAASVSWVLLGGTDDYPPHFKSSIWIAYAMIFDPGTQTGLWIDESSTSAETLTGAAIISFLGFIYMLVLLGLIVETIRHLLSYLLKSRSRIVMTGHIVILGWTDKTVYLLKEMFLEAENRGTGQQRIVILCMQDEHEMRQEIADHLPKHNHVVVCRKGCPYDANELLRVSIGSASDVIVLGQACSPRESDLEVVRVILGLAALPEPALSGRVIAEVKCADMAPVVEALLTKSPDSCVGPVAEAIHARSTVHRMLCLMAVKPVVGDALAGLSSFEYGEELYCVEAPDLWGHDFKTACQFFSQGLCIGIKPEDKQVIMAPDDDHPIEPTDRLLLIAADEVSLNEGKKQGKRSSSRTAAELAHTATRAIKPVRPTRKLLLTGQSYCDNKMNKEVSMPPPIMVNVLDQDRSGSLYVIIGWADDFLDLLMALDNYVRKGTIVHVLTEKPEDERDRLKKSPGWNPTNIKLIEQFGSRVSVESLVTLPLAEANATLILAEESDTGEISSTLGGRPGGGDGMSADSTTVTSAVMICGICEGKYGTQRMQERRGRIICEVLDPVTDRMLRRNEELKKRVTFFRSNAIETGLFAMAASEPIIFNTLVLLLSPAHDIGKLISEPVSKHCDPKQSFSSTVDFSFWELHESVREKSNDLLIGWYRLQDGRSTLGCVVDRSEPMTFALKDRLLVLRRTRPDEVPRALARTPTDRPESPKAHAGPGTTKPEVSVPVLPSPVSGSAPPAEQAGAVETLVEARRCSSQPSMAVSEAVSEPKVHAAAATPPPVLDKNAQEALS